MTRRIKRYGWIPDLPDHRDFMYAAPLAVLRALPPKKDLTAACPPVYDQGELGSCTANAIAAAHQFEQMKQVGTDRGAVRLRPSSNDLSPVSNGSVFVPSRLFIYYNERDMEGTVNEDSGAMIRDGIKSVVKQGVCPESAPRSANGGASWPYVIERFTKKPPETCYAAALNHQVVSYRRVVQSLNQMKGCIASGYPFVFGFSVYEGFESADVAKTGKVPMPGTGEAMLGGHAVAAVGYNDADQRFIVRNSWGSKWGKKGHCFMPYAYLTDPDLAADFWTIRMVEIAGDTSS